MISIKIYNIILFTNMFTHYKTLMSLFNFFFNRLHFTTLTWEVNKWRHEMGKVNKRRGIGFKSQKQQRKLDNILHSLQDRWSTFSIFSEHNYFQRSRYAVSTPYTLSDVADDIIIDNSQPRTDIDWRKGRRVAELCVLADGLRSCEECGIPLHLSHCVGIITYGLGAFLKGICLIISSY